MNPEIQFGASPLCGQTVEVHTLSGATKNMPFIGFVNGQDFKGEGAIVTGLTGFNPQDVFDGFWHEFHADALWLGMVKFNGICLVVSDGMLVSLGQREPVQTVERHNNVVAITR